MFDMKRGDLGGQTSLLERVGSAESNPRARRYERLGARSLELQDELGRARAARAKELVMNRREARARATAGASRDRRDVGRDAGRIHAAFAGARGARDNQVHLKELRERTGLPRERFDAAMRHLRERGVMSLDSHENMARSGMPAGYREAAIAEAGSELHYASLRGPRGGAPGDVVKLARAPAKGKGGGVGKTSAEFDLARAREKLATRRRTAAKLKGLKGLKDLERAPEVHARPGDYANVRAEAIRFDPERFQYKLAHSSETGSVGSLAGVKKYDPELAGAVSVWRDPADGEVYVVNGHNRLDLARRLGVDKVHVKFLDAPDAAAARAKGAITNIAEGRGTSLDAAKFFRDTGISREDIQARGVPMREKVATEGLDLARLHPHLFDRVIRGEMTAARGAILGGSGLSHEQQHAVHEQLAKLGKKGAVNDRELRELVDNARHAGSRRESGFDLFGATDEEVPLAIHRAKVAGDIKGQLAGEKRLFGLVSKSKAAEQLAEKGRSSIDVETTGHVSKEAAGILGVFDTLKNRSGPVSAHLNRAAERIANGEHRPTVVKETRAEIAREIERFFGGGGGA